MRLLKCPKCGEMFSDTYKTCPFCQEDEELHSGKTSRPGHRTGGGRAKPKVGGGAVAVCLVLVLGLVAYTVFGSQITDFFKGDKETPDPAPTVLTLSQASVDMTVGGSVVLSASGAENIEFSSGDESVATVTEDGTLQAVGAGTTVVTAKSGEQSATCQVTVEEPAQPETPTNKELVLQSIYGFRGQFSMSVGNTAPLEVVGTDSTVSWSVADSAIATIDSEGVVTAVSSGKTIITASVDGQTLSIEALVW